MNNDMSKSTTTGVTPMQYSYLKRFYELTNETITYENEKPRNKCNSIHNKTQNVHIRNIYFDRNSTVIEFLEKDFSKDCLPCRLKKVKVEPSEEDLKKYGANPYLGFCVAFTKYVFGSNSEIKRVILNRTHPKYQDKVVYLKEEKEPPLRDLFAINLGEKRAISLVTNNEIELKGEGTI